MSKHPPERPCIIVIDTREPALDAGDHPDALFRPCVFAPGTPRDTPVVDRPRVSLTTVRKTLGVGDYSLDGLEHMVAIERKSGPDLLQTLFGEGTDSVGERKPNLDRFRAELERARELALFAIVCETDEAGLFREAQARQEKYGKSFDPEAVIALLVSFAIDLGVPWIWCSPIALDVPVSCSVCEGTGLVGCPCPHCTAGHELACGRCHGERFVPRRRLLMTGKQRAELVVGRTLARVWSQATGGKDARKARERGYAPPWLGVLEGQAPAAEEPPAAPAPRRKTGPRFTARGALIPRGEGSS